MRLLETSSLRLSQYVLSRICMRPLASEMLTKSKALNTRVLDLDLVRNLVCLYDG